MPRSASLTCRLSLPARWPAPTATNTVPGVCSRAGDPVGPARVALGEHHPVGVGRWARSSGRACATKICWSPRFHAACISAMTFDERSIVAVSTASAGLGGAAARPAACGEHARAEIRASPGLDRLPVGSAARRRTMSAPLPTFMPCDRPATDRHAGGREERGRAGRPGRSAPAAERSRRGTLGSALGNDGLEHQLVGCVERGLDLVVEPVRPAVERVEGAEQVDGGVGVADDRQIAGLASGDRRDAPAARRRQARQRRGMSTIHRPPTGRPELRSDR